MTVGEKIKLLRSERGLSLKGLAKELGLKHGSQISNWEQDLNGPSKSVIPALCEFFGKEPGYFMGSSEAQANA